MIVNGKAYRSIWFDKGANCVKIIDQRWLPHDFPIVELRNREAFVAGHTRYVGARCALDRGHGWPMGWRRKWCSTPRTIRSVKRLSSLLATRPTAINLRWALDDMKDLLEPLSAHANAPALPLNALRRSATRMWNAIA